MQLYTLNIQPSFSNIEVNTIYTYDSSVNIIIKRTTGQEKVTLQWGGAFMKLVAKRITVNQSTEEWLKENNI